MGRRQGYDRRHQDVDVAVERRTGSDRRTGLERRENPYPDRRD
jgi:hypothetical protein